MKLPHLDLTWQENRRTAEVSACSLDGKVVGWIQQHVGLPDVWWAGLFNRPAIRLVNASCAAAARSEFEKFYLEQLAREVGEALTGEPGEGDPPF